MDANEQPLSPEAQDLDDLIRDVHAAEQGRDAVENVSGDNPLDEDATIGHDYRIRDAIGRLKETAGGRIVVGAIILLFILLALAFIPDWGTDDATPANGGAEVAPEAVPEDAVADGADRPPTHEELAAQDPVPLTEGTWRFFADASETLALYDFAFEPTSRFYEDDAEHNEGAYEVTETTVEMTLVRVASMTASDGESDRVEEGAWTEWFTMTRSGNIMTGTWVRESWSFGYNDGFVLHGLTEPETEIFARPQRPDDAG